MYPVSSYRLSPDTRRQLTELHRATGLSRTQVIARLIEEAHRARQMPVLLGILGSRGNDDLRERR